MVLPVYVYGHPVLRREAEDIEPDYPELQKLVKDMFDTMYAAEGIGLAAPQIGLSIAVIVIDGSVLASEFPECADSKMVLLARIIQHEYDHLLGEVFTDHIAPIRKQMIRSKLNAFERGKVKCEYRTVTK